MAFRVVILGGTSDGRQLAEQLALDSRYSVLLSFAGRTQSLAVPAAPHRVGGFGGVPGLCDFLRSDGSAALIDATHPFAAQMSAHAVAAAALTGVPLLRLECPPWQEIEGDRWTHVANMVEAAAALGPAPRRVFLSVGRLEIAAFRTAPQHEYLVRAVDDFTPDLPRARLLAARGPFEVQAERQLLERERIEVLVSKNAGTTATIAKLVAARQLGLPVILVARPRLPPALTVSTHAAALEWLTALREGALREALQAFEGARRGV